MNVVSDTLEYLGWRKLPHHHHKHTAPNISFLPHIFAMTTTTTPTSSQLHNYTDRQSPLHSYRIWQSPQSSPNDSFDSSKIWIIFVHGGAWRDPLQTCADIEPTTTHLLPHASIAGIISLNYRLSPYDSHPTEPSDPSDADRNVTHPTHLHDIASGIKYVIDKHAVKRWIGVGHSCGATLLSQYASLEKDNSKRQHLEPESLILTAGIYSLPLFLTNHSVPRCPANVAQIYADIVSSAFGDDKATYQAVSPVALKYDTQTWEKGKLIVLAHSYEDELVERQQRDVMCVALDRQGWGIVMEDGDEEGDVSASEGKRILEVRDIKGEHDFVWQDGGELARLIAEVVGRLSGMK